MFSSAAILLELKGNRQGIAAILANVGNLVLPVGKTTYTGNNLSLAPSALFSHSD
jgi:hypothetical protein